MKRRTLLFSALALVCSPAIVRASSLMAVKAVPVDVGLPLEAFLAGNVVTHYEALFYISQDAAYYLTAGPSPAWHKWE